MTTTGQQLTSKIVNAAGPKVQKALLSSVPYLQDRLSSFLRASLPNDPVLQSIQSGKLRVDFGLSSADAAIAVADIVSAVDRAVIIKTINSAKKDFVGGLVIQINPIIGTPAMQSLVKGSSYLSDGHEISWLEWLLTKGTQVIINSFEVVSTVNYDARSRSGQGFMVQTGGNFRIDPIFAGTSSDNFLTRAIASYQIDFAKIIKSEIGRRL
jgi:hypothetical protein